MLLLIAFINWVSHLWSYSSHAYIYVYQDSSSEFRQILTAYIASIYCDYIENAKRDSTSKFAAISSISSDSPKTLQGIATKNAELEGRQILPIRDLCTTDESWNVAKGDIPLNKIEKISSLQENFENF